MEDDGREVGTGRVQGGGQPRRPCPDDDDLVVLGVAEVDVVEGRSRTCGGSVRVGGGGLLHSGSESSRKGKVQSLACARPGPCPSYCGKRENQAGCVASAFSLSASTRLGAVPII